jgi:hypothetical protein
VKLIASNVDAQLVSSSDCPSDAPPAPFTHPDTRVGAEPRVGEKNG